LKGRGNPHPHKYKHGKRTKTMEFDTFRKGMEYGKTTHALRDRSYLAFLYWSGVRRSEAYEREKEDFEIKDGILLVTVPAKKQGERGGSLRIRVDLPFVNLIIERLNKTRLCYHPELRRKGRFLWPISDTTAWRIIKRVFPKVYPHFFRLNRATLFCSDPDTTIPDVKSWFGWKSEKTINFYMGVSEQAMIRMGKRLKAE
jgi:integrase